MTQAANQYERARNTLAFNVLGAARRAKNQFGTRYWFADGSFLVVSHHKNYIAHGGSDGAWRAVRKLWSSALATVSL
jgi:hypothetical protein